ncbi:MAG: ABC transporter permease, partial [Actinomycetota bacterium]
AGRRTTFAKNALLVAVVVPFWTSMLVRIYAVRFLLANNGPINGWLDLVGLERRVFLNSPGIVFVGLVYTALPFMVLPLYAAVERVDRNVLSAARDLGANAVQVFFTAFIPLVRVGL